MASDAMVICETFYSIQGEGKSSGVPAVFLRLAGCNLQCNGFSYQDPLSGEHLGCDTKSLWRQGVIQSFSEIVDQWKQKGFLYALQRGAHLVITGGEPLLQEPALLQFLEHLERVGDFAHPLFLELETNGTRIATHRLWERIHQFNVSPKLRHSGECVTKVYKKEIIAQWVACPHALFKFVIAQPSDVEEVIRDYVRPFEIETHRVWLMPEGGSQAAINEKKAWLVELCKQHVFNFTSRLQIDIWAQVVGV